MEEKKLRKGCLVRFSKNHLKYLKLSNKTSELQFSNSILAWFIDKIAPGEDHKEFVDKREIKKYLADCPTIAMLYLDYWVFDVSHYNLFRDEEVTDKFEHHFHFLIEDNLYDFIFVAKKDFEIMELFEVLT